jgi:large subunit ribosomal protein L31
MKEKIHPDYHPITVVMTDGTKYETRSTWGKAGDTLQLDVDPKTHPAWVGGINLGKTGQMEKFNNKFAFLEKGATAPKKEAKPQQPAEKKEAKAEKKAEKPVKAEKKAENKAEGKAEKKEEKKA